MKKEELKKLGFSGFEKVKSLMMSDFSQVPSQGGIYAIVREKAEAPDFNKTGTGGHFKQKDPNVSIAELKKNWVDGSEVIYIGKATSLRNRLNQYMRFGQGEDIGHYGGRFIWQLKDSRDLQVCWKATPGKDPREVEKQMIQKFKASHDGKRPFANLVD